MPQEANRDSTGIPGLDEELDGGFPKNATVLLMGPPGVGKTTFANQFTYTGLENNEGVLYVTLDSAPAEVRELAEDFSWQFDKHRENLHFMDAYSWRVGQANEAESEYVVDGPADLNQMNMTMADALTALGPEKKRIVLDSVSTLILYTDPSAAVKFIQVLSAKAKASNAPLLLTLEEGVHDKKTITTLNYVADGVIDMKIEGNERYMRVNRLAKTEHTRDWMRYRITDRGIQM